MRLKEPRSSLNRQPGSAINSISMLLELQTRDVLGPAISSVGALLSALFFWRNSAMANRMADRSIYVEGQKFLIEICKQLIADPTLWALYDNHPVRTAGAVDTKAPLFEAKLE